MIIFSNNTDTVWDFPEPWTPHTIAENGAFWNSGSRVDVEYSWTLGRTVFTYTLGSAWTSVRDLSLKGQQLGIIPISCQTRLT